MKNYLNLSKKIIEQGQELDERNGKTLALFGETLKFDLREGFPLLTTKAISFRHIVVETLWYMLGTDKITFLKNNDVNIWNLWADEKDSIGKTYGYQWRNFNSSEFDQINKVIEDIRSGGNRRMIITGWNPLELDQMSLPPCLVLMQFHLAGSELHMTVYQRSADMMLGVPYDIAEMALLLSMIANITQKTPATLTFHYGNIHIYKDHINTFIEKQSSREPKKLPKLVIPDSHDTIEEFTTSCFMITNYKPGEKIRYEIFK